MSHFVAAVLLRNVQISHSHVVVALPLFSALDADTTDSPPPLRRGGGGGGSFLLFFASRVCEDCDGDGADGIAPLALAGEGTTERSGGN
jgi:hypothetical protein